MLWMEWTKWCRPLRAACTRKRTFLWMGAALIGFSVRGDLLGVTSFVRVLGLDAMYYDRLLDLFHSPALRLADLTRLWARLVLAAHPGIERCGGMAVLVGDGLKVGKAGRKMPGVKKLHQESGSNTKPPFIMGHSCQAVGVIVRGLAGGFAALPLVARIHEGVVFSNRDKRTLLDKMILLLDALRMEQAFYLVADAYYASGKIVLALLARGSHLVTRVRSNAVAFEQAVQPAKRKRGRPRLYGKKVKLRDLFAKPHAMQTAPSPVYGEQGVQIRFRVVDLLWRPAKRLVRFVAVDHPTRGRCLLLCTNLELAPLEIVRLYGLRFKIEVSFKQALHTLGAFAYHFWMRAMTPITRKSGNQHMHRKTQAYRDAVRAKLDAYHRFIQLGLIAQGILVALATTVPALVWRHFGSWLRTVRPEACPSERVVAEALRNSLPGFFALDSEEAIHAKFIRERSDPTRGAVMRLAA